MPEEGGEGGDQDGASRVLTVPNLISLVRLCLIPVFVWLLLGRENRVGAALLLGGLGATDWVDGYIARRFNQVSDLGKVLDPVADRLLLGTAVVCLLVDGSVPALVAWPVLVREALVSAAVVALAAMGARRIDVTRAGKVGTFALMAAFPFFLAGNDPAFAAADAARAVGWACALVGLGFSYYAAARYVPSARAALAEGRAART
ncbi:MAG: CDP-alcohol phosphatidyltransferase family protein [Actinomycetota bacterium]